MLKIIATSLTLVVTLYTLTALYGYKSFYNFTNSEFLLMFEYVVFDTTTIQIIILLAKVQWCRSPNAEPSTYSRQ